MSESSTWKVSEPATSAALEKVTGMPPSFSRPSSAREVGDAVSETMVAHPEDVPSEKHT